MKLEKPTNLSKYVIIGFIAASVLAIFTVVLISILKSNATSEKKTVQPYAPNSSGVVENSENEVYTTGVFLSADIVNKRITVCDITSNEEVSFVYSGTTSIMDKYEQPITVSQLVKGQIVKLNYIANTRSLTKLSVSQDIWENIGITDIIINKNAKIISYLGNNYSYSEGTVVISNGKLISMDDIMSLDYLTIRGWEENIYSIVVTGGHGYLELAGQDSFIGGTIYVGTQLTEQITENMNLPVREGTYIVTVKNKKTQGSKEITILRDQTSVCDIREFALAAVEEGSVVFNISPKGATLLIDQELTDYSGPVTLTTGDHEIEVSLGGYKTYTGTITVEKGNISTSISLQENDSTSSNDSTGDDNSSFDNSWEDNTSEDDTPVVEDDDEEEDEDEELEESDTEYDYTQGEVPSGVDSSKTITIYWTTGADVYFNGEFVGTIKDGKLTVPKQYGEIAVDLVIDGDGDTQTVTHNIVVENDGQNVSYHFPEIF
ncbi:MAG: PEGA domain-containing protein [Clostridiales bacterium]|nr:PEGA domain-containing protein [Clostridiales bacterium]